MIARLIGLVFVALSSAAHAHPHVFVDGRVDFVFSEGTQLKGIDVTWLYDPFETLFVLSSLQIDPGQTWTLTDAQRAKVAAFESDWSDTFNGAARLTSKSGVVALERPQNFNVRLVENQLEVRFERALETPLDLKGSEIEVAFYEETYFFAFSIAKSSQLLGDVGDCLTFIDRFDPDSQSKALQVALTELGREESPEDSTIGRLFTDKIFLSCG